MPSLWVLIYLVSLVFFFSLGVSAGNFFFLSSSFEWKGESLGFFGNRKGKVSNFW